MGKIVIFCEGDKSYPLNIHYLQWCPNSYGSLDYNDLINIQHEYKLPSKVCFIVDEKITKSGIIYDTL